VIGEGHTVDEYDLMQAVKPHFTLFVVPSKLRRLMLSLGFGYRDGCDARYYDGLSVLADPFPDIPF
jgi:hypothetical protein